MKVIFAIFLAAFAAFGLAMTPAQAGAVGDLPPGVTVQAPPSPTPTTNLGGGAQCVVKPGVSTQPGCTQIGVPGTGGGPGQNTAPAGPLISVLAVLVTASIRFRSRRKLTRP